MKNQDILEIIVSELGVNENIVRIRLEELEELGKEAKQLGIDQCNRPIPDDELKVIQAREEYLEEAAVMAVSKISHKLGLFVNDDPRGNPFGVILPSGRSNNFGGLDWRLDIAD